MTNTAAGPTFDSAQGEKDMNVCNRDFCKQLEEREPKVARKKLTAQRRLVKEPPIKAAAPSAKRSKADQENDEDDIAALMDELLHIRKGNATEQINKKQEKCQKELRSGDLLFNYSSAQSSITDTKVQSRWDDDIIFKNCARSEPKKKHDAFENGSMKYESHCKFMEKYFK